MAAASPAPASHAPAPVVRLRGVTKRFGRRTAVRDLDLDVPEGCCFGLLGPNGAGKTTTLRMLYGVTRPTSGSVRVCGRDVAREGRAIRARLGVTLQENVLIAVLSPRENLRIFGRYHLMAEASIAARVESLLDFLELRSHADVPVAALSGGFQRRLAIALSLVNDPELLILDEPTTGLDPAVRLALWTRIRSLRDRGRTVLLSTHYMDEAERVCDRVAIMSEGAVVAEGAPRELIHGRLGREAVELDCAPGEEERLLPDAAGGRRRMRAGPRLMVFTDDATPLVEAVRAADREDHRRLVVRPANLEDVFLSITGTQLLEGP